MSGAPVHLPRILFVTGRLAEFALRRTLEELAPRAGFEAEVAVLPISVAALMPAQWVARHLEVPPGVDRVVLPGHCRGDLSLVAAKAGGVPVERGPQDLRELPRFFGQKDQEREGYGGHALEILAEINHAPTVGVEGILKLAARYVADGADVIDLGCDPDGPWGGVGEAVAALREAGYRVSIDSFDRVEVRAAVEAGAELVLSVNGTNRHLATAWGDVEVVALPDRVGTLEGLDETVAFLEKAGLRYRLDPILEPIGFGFSESLGRYLEVRRRYPGASMMMGVGNLTELTDVDSAGVNVLLAGFCREQSIGSVLTTAVINWARTSVKELDLARRLVHHAVERKVLPKYLEPGLVMLRDVKVPEYGEESLREIQRRIKDRNWRLFAEGGLLFALNGEQYLRDADPFELFDRMDVAEASHAFYLGYELAKAKTALLLGKAYRQDEALDWGFLTEAEESHLKRRKASGERDKTEGEAPA